MNQVETLKLYLNKDCVGIQSYVQTFDRREDFVSLLKKTLKQDHSIKISKVGYWRLERAVQVGLSTSPYRISTPRHLKLLMTRYIDIPVDLVSDFKEMESFLQRMVATEVERFGLVFHQMEHFVAVILERIGSDIYVFVSDPEGNTDAVPNVMRELQRLLSRCYTLHCFSYSKKRVYDNRTSSIIALKDLLLFSKNSLIDFVEGNRVQFPKVTKYIIDSFGDIDVFTEVSYSYLDPIVEKLPRFFLKGSQAEDECNLYARWLNLMLLARFADGS